MRCLLLTLGLLPALSLAGCKDPSNTAPMGTTGPVGAVVDPIAPSAAGTRGCNGPRQPFTTCQEIDLTAVLAFLAPPVSSLTRVAGAQSSGDVLYATAVHSASGDSTVLEVDLTDPLAPVVTDLLPAGALDAFVSTALGASTQGELGELAVLDASTLVVCELATNTILAVGRSTPGAILPFAGGASTTGGFLDSTAANALFALDPESQLCPTSDGRVFVADTRNNAVRVVIGNPLFDPTTFVLTLAGGGPAGGGHMDGPFPDVEFDAPTGLVVSCGNQLLVTERGDGGEGHRIRSLSIFGFDPGLGTLTGQVDTCVGDGTAVSLFGTGRAALVAAPTGPQTSGDGEIYWIDAGSGAVRRQIGLFGDVDCPLAALGDCTQPSQLCMPGIDDFTPGASFSTAVSGDSDLYVLESGTTLLRRFGP